MDCSIVCLGKRNPTLSASNLRLAVSHLCTRTSHLRAQFRNFERGDDLPIFDPITNVNVDASDVPGDLSMQFHFLIRLELARDSQRARQISPCHRCNGGCCNGRRLCRLFLATSEDKAWKRNAKRTPENDRRRSHRHGEGTYRSTGGCMWSTNPSRSTDLSKYGGLTTCL